MDVRKGVELSPIENNARRSRRNGGDATGVRRARAQGSAGTDERVRQRENERERVRKRDRGGWSPVRGCTGRVCVFYGEARNSVPLRSITTSGVITELPTAR